MANLRRWLAENEHILNGGGGGGDKMKKDEEKEEEERSLINGSLVAKKSSEDTDTACKDRPLVNGLSSSSKSTADVNSVSKDSSGLNESLGLLSDSVFIDDEHQLAVTDSTSAKKPEVIYTAEDQANHSVNRSVAMLETDEDNLNRVFENCDVKNCGLVYLPDLMEYINSYVDSMKHDRTQLEILSCMLRAKHPDGLVLRKTYRRVMLEWMQICRANQIDTPQERAVSPPVNGTGNVDLMAFSPCEFIPECLLSPTRSCCSPENVSLFAEFGCVDISTANQSAHDDVLLLNENNQLHHQIRTLQEQKFKSDRLVSMVEEELRQMVAEREDLRKRVSSLQGMVEKNRSLMKDCEDLRESLGRMEEDCVVSKQHAANVEKEKLVLETRVEYLTEELTSTGERFQQVNNAFEESVKISSQQKDELEYLSELLITKEAMISKQAKQMMEFDECLTECKLSVQELRKDKYELEQQLASCEEARASASSKRAMGERRLFLKAGNKVNKQRSFSDPSSPTGIEELESNGQIYTRILEYSSKKATSTPLESNGSSLPLSIRAELKPMILNYPSPLCEKSSCSENELSREGLFDVFDTIPPPEKIAASELPSTNGEDSCQSRRLKSIEGRYEETDLGNSKLVDNENGMTPIRGHRKCSRTLCLKIESRLEKRLNQARNTLLSAITSLASIRRSSGDVRHLCEQLLKSTLSEGNIPDVLAPFPEDVTSSDEKANLPVTEDDQTATDDVPPALTFLQQPNASTQMFMTEASTDSLKDCLSKEMDALKEQIAKCEEILHIVTQNVVAVKSVSVDDAIGNKGNEPKAASPEPSMRLEDSPSAIPDGQLCAVDGVSHQMFRLRRNSFLTAVTQTSNTNADLQSRRPCRSPCRRKRKLSDLPEEDLDASSLLRRDLVPTPHRPPPYRNPPLMNRASTAPRASQTPVSTSGSSSDCDSFPFNQNSASKSFHQTADSGHETEAQSSGVDAELVVGNGHVPDTSAAFLKGWFGDHVPASNASSVVPTDQSAKAEEKAIPDTAHNQARQGSIKKRLAFSGIQRSGAFEESDTDDSSRRPLSVQGFPVASITQMLERESSETESAKSSMDLESDLSAAVGVPVTLGDDHGVCLHLVDSLLTSLNVRHDPKDRSYETFSEQEIERKFYRLALAAKADRFTVGRRLEIHRRQRDLAERNVETEIQFLNGGLNVARQFCPEQETLTRLTEIQRLIKVLRQASERVSSRAEIYGAVQQEERLTRAVEVMVMHVENVIRQSADLKKQLEVLGLQADGRLTRSLETTPKDFTTVMGGRLVRDSNEFRQRRASVSLIPNHTPSNSCPATPCQEFLSESGSRIVRGNSVDGYFSFSRPRLSLATPALQLATIAQQNGSSRDLTKWEEKQAPPLDSNALMAQVARSDVGALVFAKETALARSTSEEPNGNDLTVSTVQRLFDQSKLQPKLWWPFNSRQNLPPNERWARSSICNLRNLLILLLLIFIFAILLVPASDSETMSCWEFSDCFWNAYWTRVHKNPFPT